MTPYLAKRGGVFVAVYELHGKRCRTSTRTTDPAEAAAALAALLSGGAPAAKPSTGRDRSSLLVLIDRWAISKARRLRTPQYIQQAKGALESMAALMRWGTPAQITPQNVEALRERMLEKGYSTGLVNKRMAHLSSFVGWLWRTGVLKADPMVDVSPLPHEAKRRRALSADELARLFGCQGAGAEARRVYQALFYSGLRVDIELARLTWQQVGEDGVLRFKGKGGRDRTVPISDALQGILEAQRASQTMQLIVGGLVFPRVPSPGEFDRHLVMAGIPKVDARGHVATRHSLRHSWNQELTRAGVNSEQRKHLGGWSDDTMPTGQYQDANALGLREAMNRLPRIA